MYWKQRCSACFLIDTSSQSWSSTQAGYLVMFLWVLTPRINKIIDKRVAVTNHADEDCCVNIDKSGIILQHSVFRNNWLKVCHKLAMSWRQSVSRSQFSALHHIRFKLTSAAASMIQLQNNFDRDRTRTCNPQIRSLVPYPLGHTTLVEKLVLFAGLRITEFQSWLQACDVTLVSQSLNA